MGWLDRVPKLKQAVAAEKIRKNVSTVKSVCIHGDANCARCAMEDFNSDSNTTTWQTLDSADVRRVVVAMPQLARELLRCHPKEVILAGGFIRAVIGNETIRDVDLFVNSALAGIAFCDDLGITLTSKDKMSTFHSGMDVQVVHRYPYKEPYEVLDCFDYTVTKAAIWFDDVQVEYKSICHERFYRDIARKTLVYSCDRDTEGAESIPRLMKYASYGYTIDGKSLAEIIVKTCLSLDLDNGFESMAKSIEQSYILTSNDQDWKEMNTKYVKPKPARTYEYSGS